MTDHVSAEYVRVSAADLLALLALITDCIEDLADEEQAAVDRCLVLLSTTETHKAHLARLDAAGEFFQVAIEGGLLSMGPPERFEGESA